ncbi:MAG: 4Fe-4S dicluster domain-containing protein [Clostridiales bacterium]|jgi:2-oxoglutarate ferredoxin oxidoreductase subunit delta|nr:4Fe-4S dicluster domain-containing protein [Clostridiales bacterium]
MPFVTISSERCKGCGLCVDVCPKKVLALSTGVLNQKGFHPAEAARPQDCIGCAFCGLMCPDVCIKVEK